MIMGSQGEAGQFRTPRHIIKMMVDLVKPQPDDIIIDPAMGSAGFLIEAQQYLRDNHADMLLNAKMREHFNNGMFYGNDMDRTMLRIGAMNMLLHGVDNPNISYRDSLSEQNTDNEKYTLILANPPFKGSLDYEAVSADLLKVTKTKKTELLFLALFLRILKKGGILLSGLDNGVNYLTDENEERIINTMPFDPLVNEQQRKQLEEDDCGMQFSHTVEEQLGGQMEAGLMLTHIYGDTNGEGRLHEMNVECFWATRAVKPL